jgi:hypothetical protein
MKAIIPTILDESSRRPTKSGEEESLSSRGKSEIPHTAEAGFGMTYEVFMHSLFERKEGVGWKRR